MSLTNLNVNKTSALHSLDKERLTVLLVEEQKSKKSLLTKTLVEFGYQVIQHTYQNCNLIEHIEQYNPSVLILTTDLPSKEMLNQLAEVNQFLPLPIVIFAEHDSPNVIKKAIKSGVSAYVVSEILPQRIKSIISVANERFKAEQSLRTELKNAKTQLESRKLIERAKGLLMEQKQISEKESYDTIRKMAMNQGSSLAIVAKNIIDVFSLLSVKGTSKIS